MNKIEGFRDSLDFGLRISDCGLRKYDGDQKAETVDSGIEELKLV
jgi:hypothetical protein